MFTIAELSVTKDFHCLILWKIFLILKFVSNFCKNVFIIFECFLLILILEYILQMAAGVYQMSFQPMLSQSFLLYC